MRSRKSLLLSVICASMLGGLGLLGVGCAMKTNGTGGGARDDRTIGKKQDLGAVLDTHVKHEFVDHDVEATMRTMVAEPYVHNVPTLTGGLGHYGILMVWFLLFAFAHDWIQRIHGRWFHLSREQFDALHYGGMAIFKIGIYLFNLVPYIVLCILG